MLFDLLTNLLCGILFPLCSKEIKSIADPIGIARHTCRYEICGSNQYLQRVLLKFNLMQWKITVWYTICLKSTLLKYLYSLTNTTTMITIKRTIRCSTKMNYQLYLVSHSLNHLTLFRFTLQATATSFDVWLEVEVCVLLFAVSSVLVMSKYKSSSAKISLQLSFGSSQCLL